MKPHESFSKRYLDALIAGIEASQESLPKLREAGEEIAERLMAGGGLFISSVRPDFVSEGVVRAGGLMMLRPYAPAAGLSAKDTVIFGWSNTTPDQDLDLLRELRQTGACVVGVGPAPPEEIAQEFRSCLSARLESALPLPPSATAPFGGETYPLSSLQNLVLLWALTAELVAALTRRGRMPAMYQSVRVPGSRERNARFLGSPFHETHGVPPIPSGRLGQTYLEKIGGCLRALRDRETAAMEEVARVCSNVIRDGGRVHAFLISHFPVYQLGAPGDPGWMRPLRTASGEMPTIVTLERMGPEDHFLDVGPGDLLFFLGYYRRPTQAYETARRAGCLIAEVIAGTDDPEQNGPPPDHMIHPQWPYGDALVSVPTYDVKILPASGVVQAAIYWAVVGAMGEGDRK